MPRRVAIWTSFGFWRTAGFAVAACGMVPNVIAGEEKKQSGPSITAVSPLEIVPGTTIALRLRGMRLDGASEISFTHTEARLKGEIKETKKADIPNGLEAADVGDTQVEVTLTIPPGLPSGLFSFNLVTPAGMTAAHDLRVVAAEALIDEKEPNDSFHSAQMLPFDKALRGSIKADKDVDVYRFNGRGKQCIKAGVHAAQWGSLLDAILTLYDAHQNVLSACDDRGSNHDPEIAFTLPADGIYYLSVQDAQDRGGPWHDYELELTGGAR